MQRAGPSINLLPCSVLSDRGGWMGEPGEVQWRSNISQLLDIHLETLQAFWSTLDDIDRSLWVVDPKQASPDVSYCQIIIGNDCCIVLSINSVDPRTLPECHFIGSGICELVEKQMAKK
ncbi:hypothetical protein ACFX14_018918 [Malus domestica]